GMDFRKLLFGSLFENTDHSAIEIRIDDEGMDVAFSADRWSISKALGDGFDRVEEIFLCLGFGVEFLKFLQGHCGEDCAAPGAKIFGGKIALCDFAEVIVHVAGGDVVVLSIIANVLEQFLPRN